MADTRPWGTEGPVQAEVFVVRMRGDRLELTGPCGPDPWYIESHDDDDPMEVVKRLSTNLMGPPAFGPLDLLATRSWRRFPDFRGRRRRGSGDRAGLTAHPSG